MAKPKRGQIKVTPESLAEMSRAVHARRQRCIDESQKLGITEPPDSSVEFARHMRIKLTDAGARKRRRAQVEDAQLHAHHAMVNLSAPVVQTETETENEHADKISDAAINGIDEFFQSLMAQAKDTGDGDGGGDGEK